MVSEGLNSAELFTLAQTMRDQNKPPDEIMSYSEHAGATATYAMINAFESMASGLWAIEQRQVEEAKARYLATIEAMRLENEIRQVFYGTSENH
jgi:hypothetical protein